MKRPLPATQQIPDKVYFRIGEVSSLVGVDTHVLRYWETEFAFIKPVRGKSKQRLYRRQDVESLLLIRKLLHDEGYTISGAKKYLKHQSRPQEAMPGADCSTPVPHNEQSFLSQIKQELQEILHYLRRVSGGGAP